MLLPPGGETGGESRRTLGIVQERIGQGGGRRLRVRQRHLQLGELGQFTADERTLGSAGMFTAVLDGFVRVVEMDRTIFIVMMMQLRFRVRDAMRQARLRWLQIVVPPSEALQREADQQQ